MEKGQEGRGGEEGWDMLIVVCDSECDGDMVDVWSGNE